MPRNEQIRVGVYRSDDEPHPEGITIQGGGFVKGSFIDIFTYLAPGESYAGHTFEEWKSKENKAVYLDTFKDIDVEQMRRELLLERQDLA